MENIDRRDFIKYTALGAAALSMPNTLLSQSRKIAALQNPICVFTKHLQWLDFEDLGKFISDAGFDGVDLTVRKGGHIEHDVAPKDLPEAIEKIQKSGVNVPMMVTSINDPDDPVTEPLLQTAGANGVKYYRMAYYRYDEQAGIEEHLLALRKKVGQLAAINEKYGIHGAYQNHAGERVGGPVWDLWYLLKDLDPQWIGIQYDIRHATVEGGNSWPTGFKLVKDYVKCTAIKDFKWVQDKDGSWKPLTIPLEEGMVDFVRYFELYKSLDITGPITLHFEYPIYEQEEKSLSKKEKMKFARTVMAKDLERLRDQMQKAGIVR
ncbi:MAG: sugar phosphate isomerase/epimerase [Cyclobacteriaceae bacterium]|nr:sugar phosphate isomerase/epimerase [Cyclobacteriaceae bacterium SS2]